MTTNGCHSGRMSMTPEQRETFVRVKNVRAQALEHVREARRLSAQRRSLMAGLIDEGFSQADLARELGITRQAIQKMLAS